MCCTSKINRSPFRTRQVRGAERVGVVTASVVAVLTQERQAILEQAGLVGPVRNVAVRAVFADWLVLPQERTAFFCMAGVAGVVNCVFFQQFWPNRAVRVVTV